MPELFESDFLNYLVLIAVAVPIWIYLNITKPPSKGTAVPDSRNTYGFRDEGGPVRSYGGGKGGGGNFDRGFDRGLDSDFGGAEGE